MTDIEEREAIVRWLQSEADEYPGTEYRRHVLLIRKSIRRGEHHKPSNPTQ